MPSHPLEREYQTREWTGPFANSKMTRHDWYFFRDLTLTENRQIGNSDGDLAWDYYRSGVCPPFLMDYELLVMGEDPLCGTAVKKNVRTGLFAVIVYTDRGAVTYFEKEKSND